MTLHPGGVIEFDYSFSVGGISELQAQHLRILFGLLKSVPWTFVPGFGLDHCNLEITGEAKQIIGTLPALSSGFLACHHYSAIGQGLLLCERVWVVIPARLKEPWLYVSSASIRFIQLRFRFDFSLPGRQIICNDVIYSQIFQSISIYSTYPNFLKFCLPLLSRLDLSSDTLSRPGVIHIQMPDDLIPAGPRSALFDLLLITLLVIYAVSAIVSFWKSPYILALLLLPAPVLLILRLGRPFAAVAAAGAILGPATEAACRLFHPGSW
jgi:hypothetical protein